MAFESNDPVVDGNATKGQRVFMPIPDLWQSDFDERLQQDVFDIVDTARATLLATQPVGQRSNFNPD